MEHAVHIQLHRAHLKNFISASLNKRIDAQSIATKPRVFLCQMKSFAVKVGAFG
jgi:hypothetical protein